MRLASGMKKRLEALGHGIFYFFLLAGGLPFAYLMLFPVVMVYVIASRRIHRLASPYIRRRFPDAGPGMRFFHVFRLVLSFARVLVDRAWLGLRRGAALTGDFDNSGVLLDALEEGRGLVLVTAHVGNWQTALSHIDLLETRVNSLMHYAEEEVAKHFFDLRGEKPSFNIIRNDGFMGGMIEASAALSRGEVVMVMADRWAGGPAVEVDFLGSRARFPAAAYGLAAATGVPVAVLLAAKTGMRSYSLHVWDIFHPERNRSEGPRQFEASAARFACALERYVERYPYQWYNFFDFWAAGSAAVAGETAKRNGNGKTQGRTQGDNHP